MSSYNTLISVLGWEDRFLEGIKRDIGKNEIEQIIIIEYTESFQFTRENFKKLKEILSENKIEYLLLKVSVSEPVSKWKIFESFFLDKKKFGKKILLDISTMPRDTIWSLLFFTKSLQTSVNYVYHKPKYYSSNWLSREPGKPRLLFKHSGISKLGLPTALLVVTGFESERTKQLVNFFEPKLTILAFQSGNQYENKERNNKEIHDSIRGYTEILDVEIDAYSEDNGYYIIKKIVEDLKNNYNIIVASLGPKITSIAIYKVFNLYPDIALSYVPARQLNQEYSTGISDSISGKLE